MNRNDSGTSNNGNQKDANGFFSDMVENETETNNGEKEHSKAKKKKKKSNERLQMKKQRKIHDVEGQFEGLTMPNFSGLVLTDNMNFETSEQAKGKEKSKKHKIKKNKKNES